MSAGSELLAWKKAIEATPLVKLTDCPMCEWPLGDTPEGLHCAFCGWLSS